jgi:uncharacterized protein DUF1565
VRIGVLGTLCLFAASAPAAVWHAATGPNASDANPGTVERPVQSVAKALSLAKPGDAVAFSAGTHSSSKIAVPDGRPHLPIILRSNGKGMVVSRTSESEG